MRTHRRGPWITVAGLLVAASIGCQTITDVDRSLIPGSGGGGGQGSDAGKDGGTSSSGQGGGSDAGGQ